MDPQLKQFARKYLPFAVPAAKSLLQASRHVASKRKAQHILSTRKEIWLEVGAGEKCGKGNWVTIDITDTCDLYWDLRRGLPFPDSTVSRIYSSHFFEHLSFKETQLFLKECRRALKDGGKFSICVPNARIYLDAYVRGQPLDPNVFFGYKPAYNSTTNIDAANYIAYMDGEHKYMFDSENLLHILGLAGFRDVTSRSFDPEIDLPERDFGSLYAEAFK